MHGKQGRIDFPLLGAFTAKIVHAGASHLAIESNQMADRSWLCDTLQIEASRSITQASHYTSWFTEQYCTIEAKLILSLGWTNVSTSS